MNVKIQFNAERVNFGRSIALRFFGEGKNRVHLPRPIMWDAVEEDALDSYQEPPLTLRPEEAQNLMDELWRTGLRPTEGTGSAGSLAATERHLKDMQTIVMHTLKIKKGAA
jgi:hypothetical protein